MHTFAASFLIQQMSNSDAYITDMLILGRLSLGETGEQQGVPVTQARPSHALKNKGLFEASCRRHIFYV